MVAGIESFTKRSAVRNVEDTAGLDKAELGILYDKFYNVLYYKQKKSNERNSMDAKSFPLFIGSIASWAKIESTEVDAERQLIVAKNFFNQLFDIFDKHNKSNLTLQVNKGGEDPFCGGVWMATHKLLYRMSLLV